MDIELVGMVAIGVLTTATSGAGWHRALIIRTRRKLGSAAVAGSNVARTEIVACGGFELTRMTPVSIHAMFTDRNLEELLSSAHVGPCVSLYQPTHRRHPENQQDPIRFRNLLKQAAESLKQQHSATEIDSLLAGFYKLADDIDFWNHTADGLAVFGAPDLFRVVRLQRTVAELVIVAASFHVKPLLRIVQSADRFQLLAINRHEIRLFEGTRDTLDEIDLAAEVPRTATEALGEETNEPEGLAHSYGTGPAAAGAGANRGPGGTKTGGMRHGHGSKKT